MSGLDIYNFIEAALICGGYDGLYNPGTCACLVGDLAPCGGIQPSCEAGYKVVGESDHCDQCPGCDWHVQAEKPPEAAV